THGTTTSTSPRAALGRREARTSTVRGGGPLMRRPCSAVAGHRVAGGAEIPAIPRTGVQRVADVPRMKDTADVVGQARPTRGVAADGAAGPGRTRTSTTREGPSGASS